MLKLAASLHIGLTRNSVALLRSDGWPHQHRSVLADLHLDTNSPQQLVDGLSGVLAGTGCTNLHTTVVLGNELTRLFMVTPPLNTERLRDCHAAAEMRFLALYGEPVQDYWTIVADWDACTPFLACAMPTSLLDALKQVSSQYRLKLVGIFPQFIADWNCWQQKMQAGAWFGSIHEDILSLGAIDRQRLVDVHHRPIPQLAHLDQQWLLKQLSRTALRLALQVPKKIQLCGNVPGEWLTQSNDALVCTRLEPVSHATDHADESATIALARTGVRS
jgi:hypothetical protein